LDNKANAADVLQWESILDWLRPIVKLAPRETFSPPPVVSKLHDDRLSSFDRPQLATLQNSNPIVIQHPEPAEIPPYLLRH
jgi:hypothetical protein